MITTLSYSPKVEDKPGLGFHPSFFAASARALIDNGYLRLEPDAAGVSRFGLVEVDVGDGVPKAVHFANSIQQLQRQSVPPLRCKSGRVALAR